MFKNIIIFLLVACMGAGSVLAQTSSHEVKTFEGTLQTGIISMGGETTGIILKAKDGGKIELDLGKNTDLAKLADELNGKDVVVTGVFTTIKGTEIKNREVLTVQSLKEAK